MIYYKKNFIKFVVASHALSILLNEG